MNAKTSRLLRKFAKQDESLSFRKFKKEYNKISKNKRFEYKRNLKTLID